MSTNYSPLSLYSSTSVILIVGVLHYVMALTANRLAQGFAGHSSDLPWLTKLLVNDSIFYWIPPTLLTFCFIAHHLGYLSRKSILLVSSVGTLFTVVVCVMGLYLAVVLLGGLVGS